MRPALAATLLAFLALLCGIATTVAAGPPFPPPVDNQAVYDTAGVLRPGTVQVVERTIDDIEARTGAEIVVYTQLMPVPATTSETEQHARALMDQWGVGRKGFDDGLVILFDLNADDPCHGQVQLYAGPGFAAEFLSNQERQAIYENDMRPLLRACDRDAALLTAMTKIDASATPEHAGTLSFFRLVNAVLGLLVAPLLALGLIGWGILRWVQHGRDPVYLDDPSIHIPAPPPGLTPAAGALVRDGRSTRRALTTASLDLATRGLISFESARTGLLGRTTELTIHTAVAQPGDADEEYRRQRARARPMDAGTAWLQSKLVGLGGRAALIDKTKLLELGNDVGEFDKQLETHAVSQGWFGERPSDATTRWVWRGIVALILGGIALFAGINLPSDGLNVVGAGLLVAGVFLVVLARSMPARTMPGAMVRAMLEAYRRTLEKTMAQARSMGEVVQASAIPLIEGPDDAVVWGVALGLQAEVEQVLERTADDLRTGAATGGYLPLWYGGVSGSGGGGGTGGWAPGVMSSSAIPNFGGMMAVLGTIGNSPSSSGGGGFGGGGSGGGGGGAGGGF